MDFWEFMKFAKRWNYLQHQLWSGCDSGRVDRGRNVVRIPQKLEVNVYFFWHFNVFIRIWVDFNFHFLVNLIKLVAI